MLMARHIQLSWMFTILNDEKDDQDSLEEDFDEELLRVEDEDWEIAERDFTKHFNRLKQHVAVRTGTASGLTLLTNKNATVASLPAVNSPALHSSSASKQTVRHAKDKASDQLAALSKFSSRISQIDAPYALVGGVGVNRKGPSAHANQKDKSDRATNEQVLDPRTRLILFKAIGRGMLEEINGCVSTGKEANVYHALAGSTHLAIKIYKTSILVFKDRTRYVEGEHRFRRGTNTSNPRKMVRLWAEKELRNLKRLASAGVSCPTPVEVRENVLIMEFIGDAEGWASPRLKDATLPDSSDELARLYAQLVLMIRRMYQECKLSKPFLVIIDVSQSVEAAHPHAWDFLRTDVKNVEEFWVRRGVKTLGLRATFDFITREDATDKYDDVEAAFRAWLQVDESTTINAELATDVDTGALLRAQKAGTRDGEMQAHEDAVFLNSHIPRSFAEMRDPERFIERQKEAEGLVSKATESPVGINNENEGESEDVESSCEGESQEGTGDFDPNGDEHPAPTPRGHRHEDKEAKKDRKKAVKAENKERRKHKMPKAEKKKGIKRTKAGK
ncbi:RIO1-domain-containing protein [Flagelloscypha sp. PMI_526]|nr:RIO1-domain-containing protein [Flagelloscypha sp. PMI_526]